MPNIRKKKKRLQLLGNRMSIASDKKAENIVEYILYLWQMEDLLRAVQFDLEAVAGFFEGQLDDESVMEEMAWFKELRKQMQVQKIERKGHVHEVTELTTELAYLHASLLNVFQDKDYIKAYEEGGPELEAFKKKSDQQFGNEIEPGLIALYGLLTLKLKRVEISEETLRSMTLIQRMFAILADRYGKMKRGELTTNLN